MPTVSGNVGAVFNGGTITQPLKIDLSAADGSTVPLEVLASFDAQAVPFFEVVNSDASGQAILSVDAAGEVVAQSRIVGGPGNFLVRTAGNPILFTGEGVGFFGANPTAATKQTVTGSKGANAALASLLAALVTFGLITDSTT